MTDGQLLEIQKQLFFQFGFKIDLYHFENIREIVVVKNGNPLTVENTLKVFNY